MTYLPFEMLLYKIMEHLEPIYTCRSSFRIKPSIEKKTGSMRGWPTM